MSHRTTLNTTVFNLFWIDLEIQFQSRCMSDPPLSDIDLKKWLGYGLPLNHLPSIKINKPHLECNLSQNLVPIYPWPTTNHPQNLPQNLNSFIRERQSHHIKKKLVLYDHFWIRKTMKFRVWNKKIWKK